MKISSLLCRLVVCVLIFAAAAHAENEIMQIKLQRTSCYGTCPNDEITLNADGSAQFRGDKNSARDGFFRGTIAPAQFAVLVKALQDENFFDLRPQIGNRWVTDVPDIIVSATRKNSTLDVPYTVASRGGTPLLTRLQNAFDKLNAQIQWQRDELASNAGVRGTVKRDLTAYETQLFADRKPAITALSLRYALVKLIAMEDIKIVYATRSDNEGQFQIDAPPGKYLLSVNDLNDAYNIEYWSYLPRWLSDGKIIEVTANQFGPIELQLHDHNDATKPNK